MKKEEEEKEEEEEGKEKGEEEGEQPCSNNKGKSWKAEFGSGLKQTMPIPSPIEKEKGLKTNSEDALKSILKNLVLFKFWLHEIVIKSEPFFICFYLLLIPKYMALIEKKRGSKGFVCLYYFVCFC